MTAQAPTPGREPHRISRAPSPYDVLVSPEVEGRDVTFRIYAPMASDLALQGDLAEDGPITGFIRSDQGVWSLQLRDVQPGTYRYQFVVDKITVPDPRNPTGSPTHTTLMSLVHVDGSELSIEDIRPLRHGAVSRVYYHSPIFGGHRSMHVYTPTGYERGSAHYPVLYLLHGGGDCDASWSTVGRAGVILDNLIAPHLAVPMIVVMPSGHAPGPQTGFPNSPAMTADPANDPFTADLLEGVIPHIEGTYRVRTEPEQRALAGLSMGGVQAANIGLVHARLFRYLGIFSSGWFPEVRAEFERRHAETLRAASAQYRLVWTAWGRSDIARSNSLAMLQMFDRHGLRYTATETEGGHTWMNWRRYLAAFAPLLFR
ncbi:MAG: esterase [Chloroflexi bacterium]|nr:esterase [Chloroflexota bacterium]